MDAAIAHCTKGAGIWDWVSNEQGAEPDGLYFLRHGETIYGEMGAYRRGAGDALGLEMHLRGT